MSIEVSPAETAALRTQIDDNLSRLRKLESVPDFRAYQKEVEDLVAQSESIGYPLGKAKALGMLAFAYYMRSEFRLALTQAQKSREILLQETDPLALADVYGVLSLTHWSLGNYDLAVELGLQCMRIQEEQGNEEGLAWAYTTAGGINHDIGDQKQALEYQLKAIELFKRHGNDLGLARALTNLGVVYRAMGEFDAALRVHQESLELFRKTPNPSGQARALNDIGAIYQDLKEYDRALEYHQQALAIREASDTPQALTTSQINIGHIYRVTGRFEEAAAILMKALVIAEAIEVKPRIYQAHLELAELFEATGDLARALEHHKAYHQVRDQVFSDETNAKLHNLQLAYEMESSRRDAEIQRLKNVELAQLLGEVQAAQAQLVQSGKMAGLGDLVAGVAHELNSPLAVIMSASQLNDTLAKRLVCGEANERQVRALETFSENNLAIHAAAARINRIVRSLKGFARLDEAEYQLADLHQGIEETLVLLERKFLGRIEIRRSYGKIPKIYCYAAELNQVYRVLLENAFEAIEGEGFIDIRSCLDGPQIRLTFADSGRGIPPDILPKLFHPRFRNTGSRVEARMGLFGAYHILQKHGGDIRVESNSSKGSAFTLILPAKTEDTPESTARPKLS